MVVERHDRAMPNVRTDVEAAAAVAPERDKPVRCHIIAGQPFEAVVHRNRKFADSPLEQAGFELVWGFSCQVVVLGFAESSLFGAGKPFFIPSPAIRFAERAEGVKGPKR
jgi:hypothetical protein